MAPGIDALHGGARRHAAAFEGVTVTRRRRELVQDASFTVGAGAVHALLGHNGGGPPRPPPRHPHPAERRRGVTTREDPAAGTRES
jgi:hypothetical protein